MQHGPGDTRVLEGRAMNAFPGAGRDGGGSIRHFAPRALGRPLRPTVRDHTRDARPLSRPVETGA